MYDKLLIITRLVENKMLAIDHTLLSDEALENLIIDIITRQATDYSEHEIEIQVKKNQLLNKLKSGDAIIVYSSEEECCNIIRKEDFQKLSSQMTINQ